MTAHDQVRSLCDEIRDICAAHGVKTSAMDKLEVLTEAYMDPGEFEYDWDKCGLTLKERSIAELLHKRLGKSVRRASIMMAMYSGDANGGPEPNIINVFVHKLRKKLLGSGFWIKSDQGIGYRMLEGEPPERGPDRVIWEGVTLGWRCAAAATLLKANIGNVVPYGEFGHIHSTVVKTVERLRINLAGLYTIHLAHGVGYRMTRKA